VFLRLLEGTPAASPAGLTSEKRRHLKSTSLHSTRGHEASVCRVKSRRTYLCVVAAWVAAASAALTCVRLCLVPRALGSFPASASSAFFVSYTTDT
jgi:hypothetical protein